MGFLAASALAGASLGLRALTAWILGESFLTAGTLLFFHFYSPFVLIAAGFLAGAYLRTVRTKPLLLVTGLTQAILVAFVTLLALALVWTGLVESRIPVLHPGLPSAILTGAVAFGVFLALGALFIRYRDERPVGG